MTSIHRFAIGLGISCVVVACASAAPASRPAAVYTTSAVLSAQCRAPRAECFHSEDCCSASCDYDLGYCH